MRRRKSEYKEELWEKEEGKGTEEERERIWNSIFAAIQRVEWGGRERSLGGTSFSSRIGKRVGLRKKRSKSDCASARWQALTLVNPPPFLFFLATRFIRVGFTWLLSVSNKKIFLVNFEIFKPTKYYLFYRYVFMNRIYLILTSMEDLLQSIFSIFIIFLKNSAVEDCITFISLWLWANYRHEVVTTFPLRSRNSKAPNFTIRMCVHPIVLILYIYYIHTCL